MRLRLNFGSPDLSFDPVASRFTFLLKLETIWLEKPERIRMHAWDTHWFEKGTCDGRLPRRA